MFTLFNLRHPRNFKSTTSRRGTLYYAITLLYAIPAINGTRNGATLILVLNCSSNCNTHDYGSRFALSASGGSCGRLITLLHHYVEAGCQMGSRSVRVGSRQYGVEMLANQNTRCGHYEVWSTEVGPDNNAVHPLAPKRNICLLYTSPSPRDKRQSRMPSSA